VGGLQLEVAHEIRSTLTRGWRKVRSLVRAGLGEARSGIEPDRA
jgi:hypothetical protein